MSDIVSSGDILVAWIFVHIGMEGIAGYAADKGARGPGYLFVGITLALYLLNMVLNRDRRWYNILLLFVPVVAGVLLHQMSEGLAEHLFDEESVATRGGSMLAVFVPCGILFLYLWLSFRLAPDAFRF